MDEQYILDLLKRYGAGQCSDAEKKMIEQWYAEELGMRKKDAIDVENIEALQEGSWKSIQPDIRKKINEGKRSYRRLKLWMVAATVLLVLGNIWFWTNRREATAIPALQYVLLQTAKGEVKEMQLPDGTIVWLNAGTVIRYSDQFDKQSRELILDGGEAYFNVAHKKDKPFMVTAGKTRTTVLGTVFNIRAYDYMDQVQISVEKGKVGVSIEGKDTAVKILPNEQLSVDKAEGRIHKSDIRSADFTSWRLGILQFNDEALSTITKMIEYKYEIKSRFENKNIGKLRFTAGFKTTDTLEDILDDLCIAGNLQYKLQDNEIIFSFNK